MQTQAEESLTFWATPRPNGNWSAHYWESAKEPWRQDLLDALAPSAPFTSIFEVGCNSGPNYRRLRETFGDFPYTGLDVNGAALASAVHYVRRDQIPGEAHWFIGSILTDAVKWGNGTFDLVFASSVISLVAPTDVEAALAGMLRLSARIVALQEPSETVHNGCFHQWAHDYRAALAHVDRGEWQWTAHGPVLVGERPL